MVYMAQRVLIVEDEMLVGMMIEDSITSLGLEVAGIVTTVDAALAKAHEGGFDFAILDVHLNGKPVFPVADILLARNVPFIFATGYGEHGIPEKYSRCATLQKPFLGEELENMIRAGI
jgi:DNA-binding response OmpR family regulator